MHLTRLFFIAIGSTLALYAEGGKAKSIAPVLPISSQAVSAINGKFEGFFGDIDQETIRGAAASLSIPVGQRFGVQLDTLYAHTQSEDLYGFGGHFFTRNPEKGLIGIIASSVLNNDVSNSIYGAEAELYLNKVTIGGILAYQNIDLNLPSGAYDTYTRNKQDFAYVNLYAALYPIENLMLKIQYTNRSERNVFGAIAEYQTPVAGLSMYVDYAVGDANYSHILGGLRYYFGAPKTLKRRHREDDPASILPSLQQNMNRNVTEPMVERID
jgi:hypothetical protein